MKNAGKLLIMMLFCFPLLLFANNAANAFEQGNKAYQQQKYHMALKEYEKVLLHNQYSSDLFFNVGNCFYKLNQMPKAIYYYEKSLLVDPGNYDAKVNLAYANKSNLDVIEALPLTFTQKIYRHYIAVKSVDFWAKWLVATILINALVWVIFIFYNNPFYKKMMFGLGVFLIFVVFALVGVTTTHYHHLKYQKNAIVFSTEVLVKSEPMNSAKTTVTIHEGSKVVVLDKVGSWQKIKLANGFEGWVPEKSIEII